MKKQLQEPALSVVSRLEPSEKDDLISRKALMQRLHDAGGCGAPPESWADGYDKAIDLAYGMVAVSYTHLRAHETRHDLVCRLLLEKKKL